jgi:hypothetical protein
VLLAGKAYAATVVYEVLGATTSFDPASLGTGAVSATFKAAVVVPNGSTALVQLYDFTNHNSLTGELGPFAADTEISQAVVLAAGSQQLEVWMCTPNNAGGACCCMKACLRVDFS